MQNAVWPGYLLDDSTGQPEGGEYVLMDNQAGAIAWFVEWP